MSIDYYVCKRCEKIFPDVIDYKCCQNCYSTFCSEKCANIEYDDEVECEDEDTFPLEQCSSCRYEFASDKELLEFALECLKTSRDDLFIKWQKEQLSEQSEQSEVTCLKV